MNITVEKQPKCKAILNAQIPVEEVSSLRKEIVANYVQGAPLKGFRKGKVPKNIIEKTYKKQIEEELTGRLFENATNQVFEVESDLKVLDFGSAESVKLNEDGSATISSEMLIVPAFELPEYKGIEVKVSPMKPTDDDVQKAIDSMLEEKAEYNEIPEALEDGMVAVIDFSTSMADGTTVAEAAGREVGFLKESKGQWISMQDDAFLPGFNDQLKGHKAGDEVKVTVTVPEGFPIVELVGKELIIDVKINEVRQKVLPEFNDAFADGIVAGVGAEKLKELVKIQLTNQKRMSAENEKVEQIVEKIIAGLDFELPENLVQSEEYGIMQRRLNEMLSGGNLGGNPQEAIAKLRETAHTDAERNVRAHFVVQEVARIEGIRVDDNELFAEIQRMAEQEKTPIKAFITKLRKANRINSIRMQLLTAKTLGHLIGLSVISYEDPTDEPAVAQSTSDAPAEVPAAEATTEA